jgi:heparin/heparan-sulfate lyase
MLVYQPGERFFWGENLWPAANDGGQRMDSSRFWNSVRSLEDWRRTRDLWDRGHMDVDQSQPGAYTYARGDGARAYQPSKVERFVRELVWLPGPKALFVLDRVRSTDPSYRKAWLLHGVAQPKVEGGSAAEDVGAGGTRHRDANVVAFEDGQGRLRVHAILPAARDVIVRGGAGFEFWTPGDEFGGAWGSGKNWPLDPAEGGPLPADPYLARMFRTFWGQDFDHLSPSNRRAVVPGAWRMETTPSAPSRDDVFLHVLEIGDVGAAPLRIERVSGHGLAGAVVANAAAVLMATGTDALAEAEVTLPDVASRFVLVTGLVPRGRYDLQITSGFAPGAPVWRLTAEANDEGVIQSTWDVKDARLRVRRVDATERSER